VSGGHDERGTEGASIEGPKGAEWGGYGEGCPLHSRLRGLGERRELPQRGPGRSPGRYHIFCIKKNWCVHQTPGGVGGTCPSAPCLDTPLTVTGIIISFESISANV